MRVELLLFFMGIQNIRLLNVCTATKKIPYFFLFVEINPKSPCTVNGLRKQVGVVFLYFDVLFREPLSGAKKKNQNQNVLPNGSLRCFVDECDEEVFLFFDIVVYLSSLSLSRQICFC